jgi:hypothetical protein
MTLFVSALNARAPRTIGNFLPYRARHVVYVRTWGLHTLGIKQKRTYFGSTPFLLQMKNG